MSSCNQNQFSSNMLQIPSNQVTVSGNQTVLLSNQSLLPSNQNILPSNNPNMIPVTSQQFAQNKKLPANQNNHQKFVNRKNIFLYLLQLY